MCFGAEFILDAIEGMKSGLFKYFAHPDLYATGISCWDEHANDMAKRICEAAVKYDIPLEYNLGGFRYPYEKLFKGLSYNRYPSRHLAEYFLPEQKAYSYLHNLQAF